MIFRLGTCGSHSPVRRATDRPDEAADRGERPATSLRRLDAN
jgi:hypothetical protein